MNPSSVVRKERKPGMSGSGFDRLVPLLSILILLVCYSPVLLTQFGFCDDYTILGEGVRGGADIQKFQVASGRPGCAVLMYVAFHTLGSIDNLVYLRLVGILGLGLFAWRLYHALRLAGWNRPTAFFLPLIIATMPSFQVFVAWPTMAFCTWTGALSGCTWQMAERSFSQPISPRKWIFATAAVLMLVLGITIHQSAAMMFWIFVAIGVFRADVTPSRAFRQLAWHTFIVFAALAIGFVIFKLGMAFYGHFAGGERSGLAHNPIEKLRWFVTEPLVNALGMAELFPRRRFALILALVLGGGLLCYFRGTMRDRLLLAIMAAALFPLSHLPNLVVAESWASYRTIAGMTGLCVLYSFIALQGYCKSIRWRHAEQVPAAVAGVAWVACAVMAAWNVQIYFARPQAAELNWLRQQLRRGDLANASGIYLIGLPYPEWHSRRYDEFGIPSTSQPWSPIPMVYLVLMEIDPNLANLKIEYFRADGKFDPSPSTVVVDMRNAPLR